MKTTDKRLADLSAREKRALLEELLRKKTDRPKMYPASFSQQRMWVLDQLEPGQAHFVIATGLRLRGALGVRALARSLNAIVRRHDALRTTFTVVDGRPMQVVSPVLELRLSVIDVTGMPDEARETEAQRLLEADDQRPFDLERGPLIRASIIRMAEQDHVLLLAMHHIISDGWSMGVLVREIGELYTAYRAGREPELPPLPIQYADFTLWQRDWMQGEVLEEQLRYWREQLSGRLPVLDLPTDHPRPAVHTMHGAIEYFDLGRELGDAVKTLSQREGVTLFMTLLTGFKALLHRYTGQDDIIVGSLIANRNRIEIEGLIGFFVNTLVLRTQLDNDPSFRELLHRVRETTLGAYAHQDLPVEKLIEALQPERDLSRTPLFQVLFVLQNAPLPAMQSTDLEMRALAIVHHISAYDILLSLEESSRGIHGHLAYSTDLFERETAQRMLAHYRQILWQATREPGASIVAGSLLGEVEQRRVLDEWSGRVAEQPDVNSIVELFEAQVERTPEAVAVVEPTDDGGSDAHVSYAVLNRRANRLAERLRRMGIGPEKPVGVCLPRSLEMLASVLGTLKAGGGYVPLDPTYPQERLAYMLVDSGASVVLTAQDLTTLPDVPGVTRVYPEADSPDIACASFSTPHVPAFADNLAYVIYTSGSTGQSKGVAVAHGGLANYIGQAVRNYALSDSDRVLQFAALSWDTSVEEIWPSLTSGATLVLRTEGMPGSGETFWRRGEELGVTLMNLPTAYWQELVSQLDGRGEMVPGRLRLLIIGGERALGERVKQWRAAVGARVRLVNTYGATETTAVTTEWVVSGEGQDGDVPIGRPLGNVRVYVLDRRMQPVPVGVPGELHVGGVGVARGYLNRAELTAERFVPNSFTPSSKTGEDTRGGRLYRTGDMVRWRREGVLEYVGRVDAQVKVRGYRIEVSEVEAVLSGHAGVREAALAAQAMGLGDTRLVAYVVPHVKDGLAVSEVRQWMRARLPEFMLPGAFVMLEALPRTPSGKIDRRALPDPDQAYADWGQVYVAPRNPMEEVLGGIWSEVLHADRVSVHDNFFDLGGHSLLATQVVSRVRKIFQVDLPLRGLFESPTVAALAESIDRARRAGDDLLPPPILPAPRDEALPLSFAQERLWFLDQLAPGNTAYNTLAAVRLIGPLDAAALARSIETVIARHESLRTVFVAVNGEPRQIVAPMTRWHLPVVDLLDLPADRRECEARRLAAAEARHSFSLSAGPLIHAALLHLDETERVLLLTAHHIVTDGWSMNVLIGEVGALYHAYRTGGPMPLADLPIQYADFAAWQRRWLRGETLERQLAYWRQHLTGAPAALELPIDHPRPAMQTFQGAAQSIRLPRSLCEALLALSRREGVTLFMLLLAAFKTLLYRYTGQADIVVGTPIANRNRTEIEALIGFFANTLVLRTRFDDASGELSFRELLRRVRENALDAYAHQDVPFEKLVEELQPERHLSRTPLFQVMFVLQNAPAPDVDLGDLSLRSMPVDGGAAQFDLEFNLSETPEGIQGACKYNRDLFEPDTIARMAGHFQTLLEGIAAQPDRRLSDLPLLTVDERCQLLIDWNDSAADFPRTQCFHQLFESHAMRTPDALAAVCRDEALTYRALDAQANRLAHALIAEGIGPDAVVALLAERGLALLSAILAAFKAGGAYLPLDPAYPARRLLQMVEQSRAALVLTTHDLVLLALSVLESLPADSRPRVLAIDDLLDADWPQATPSLRSTPGDLAYVIYTSGSTGVPKGAMVEQRGMLNHIYAKIYDLDLSANDRIAQTASQCFDISVWQFLAALTLGGSVHIYPDDTAHDPDRLLQHVEAEGISILEIVPSLMRAMLESMAPRESTRPELRALRWLVPTGEALPPELCRQWLEHYPRVPLTNAYGPTECSDDVTHYAVHLPPDEDVIRIPIGRPVANMQLYILDDRFQPSPIGVPGELYVGGVGVGRGYLNRPDLTAERFVPFPSFPPSSEAGGGQRLYRTGDLARWLPGGVIDFLGRIDHQVKIRGFRIELGEIESALAKHPVVQDVVVVAREADRPSADRVLVAYLVARQREAVALQDLKALLKETLPDYMLPSAFVFLEAMPLTPNGKVDRKALPAPDLLEVEMQPAFIAARTPTEDLLAGIWREVLRVERIGARDNFFELGGHSLLATQVASRVRNIFRVEMPLRSLFEFPTLAGLAHSIDLTRRGGSASVLPALQPVARDGTLPLSFAQERLWFLDQLAPGNVAYNIPAAMRLSGPLNVEALGRSLAEVIRRHESLRTTFRLVDGQPRQIVAEPAAVHLPVADLQDLPEPEREAEAHRLAREEATRPFDLSRGPLVRAGLLRLNDGEYVALLAMHHVVSDGWSMGVLIDELVTLYAAFARGEPASLLDLPVQYADFAVWQRQWLRGDVLESQLAYWRNQLADAPAALALPFDLPRPAVQTFRGATHGILLPASLVDELRALSRREGATLFMTLLAGFQALLHRYTGQDDIVIGSPIANRNWSEIEGLIGFFVNTLVLRTDVSGDPSVRELLQRARETALGAYAHQDLPFEKLVEALQPQRELNRTPLFQVMFVLQNAPLQTRELPGLAVRPLAAGGVTAKFDLTLSVDEIESGLAATLEYNTDLFERETIARMLRHFQALLEGMAAHPDARLSDLPLLNEDEQHQLLVAWNDTQVDFGERAAQPLHRLFEAQVERTPEAIALVFDDRHVTYHELNRRANQIARHLRSHGVAADVLVGLCIERSLEMVLGILGTLKAGGAYAPIDPAYPKERLAFMLEDTRAPIALVLRASPGLQDLTGLHCVRLDADWEIVAQASGDNLDVDVSPDHLAYAIYTSGSTGKPKGAMVSHRAIVNHMLWMQAEFGWGSGDSVLQKTPFSFDASVWEFYAPLLTGGRLVVALPEGHLDAAYLVRLINEHHVTALQLVPTLLRVLLEERTFDSCLSLTHVFCGGEPLPVELAERFRARLPKAELYNLYGPTEATIDATWWRWQPAIDRHDVPIGRPVANMQAYILNERMRPSPIGVFGELYLGGTDLARGYWQRPELTAERFVPDPFTAHRSLLTDQLAVDGEQLSVSGRLYRTGDLARYRADGAIEFLGRADFQTKLRGMRIELGEIEATLRQHPSVREAVAIIRDDRAEAGAWDRRLTAYLVPVDAQAPTANDVRRFLAEKLPEYMLPSAFVFLEKLPLTPSGKVDRRALPAPERDRPELEAAYVPPRTEVERAVAAIWQEVLDLEQVGVHDNFFELGGHSLLLIQVHVKLRQAFDADVSLLDLFRYPTVSTLSRFLRQGEDETPFVEEHYERGGSRREALKRQREMRQAYRTKQSS